MSQQEPVQLCIVNTLSQDHWRQWKLVQFCIIDRDPLSRQKILPTCLDSTVTPPTFFFSQMYEGSLSSWTAETDCGRQEGPVATVGSNFESLTLSLTYLNTAQSDENCSCDD